MDKLTDPKVVDAGKETSWGSPTGRNYVGATASDRCHIALNCYEPGANDEMHCHPGSDHTFFVVEGECTMKFVVEGECTMKFLKGGSHPAQGDSCPGWIFLSTQQHG